MSPRILVIGAGISGLCCAWRVAQQSIDVDVVDTNARVGGWLDSRTLTMRDVDPGFAASDSTASFVIETGPDAILSDKPRTLELLEELGLTPSIVRTNESRVGAYLVKNGQLAAIPPGFSVLAPTDLGQFFASDVVSTRAKLRAAVEAWLPARARDVEDESLASFVRRRFGEETLRSLAEPIASGIYGADPERLSLDATMPRFAAMERAHGSVARAAKQKPIAQKSFGARYSMFIAFKNGMSQLTDALHRNAVDSGVEVHLQSRVSSISKLPTGSWRAHTRREYAAVVFACSSGAAAKMLPADMEIRHEIDAIPHRTVATMTYVFRRDSIAHPLDANGFVVPRAEKVRLLASTWASQKWPQRAPKSHAVVRVFFREEDSELPESELYTIGLAALRTLLGQVGDPTWHCVSRFPNAMPQYEVGHLARCARIERLAAGTGLFFAGNSLAGVGIPDTLGRAELVAKEVRKYAATLESA